MPRPKSYQAARTAWQIILVFSNLLAPPRALPFPFRERHDALLPREHGLRVSTNRRGKSRSERNNQHVHHYARTPRKMSAILAATRASTLRRVGRLTPDNDNATLTGQVPANLRYAGIADRLLKNGRRSMLASRQAAIKAWRLSAGVSAHENHTTGSKRCGMVGGNVTPGTSAKAAS